MVYSIVKIIFRVLIFATGIFLLMNTLSCRSSKMNSKLHLSDTLYTNISGKGWPLNIHFTKGTSHNHPLMAIWISDTNAVYIETLYVAKSIAKGVFEHGDESTGKWKPGPIRRPAALPVWSHSRNIREKDGLFIPMQETALPDAITGATPSGNFLLITRTSSKQPAVFDVYFEINQSWDWNEFWTNNKYPDDEDYKTSCQPSLIYRIRIDTQHPNKETLDFQLVGLGHFSGDNGKIYSDLKTITTAKNIAQSVEIQQITP